MKNTSLFFVGLISTTGAMLSPLFGANLPLELEIFRKTVISNSVAVYISAEKLKANYKILEADETTTTATYKVADMPKEGFHATVMYRLNPFNGRNEKFDDSLLKTENREEREAALDEKQKNFPKPFPFSVICVEIKTGNTFEYEFDFRKGTLFTYDEFFDEMTQMVSIEFHPNQQIARFLKGQNNALTGMEYMFDKDGKLIEAIDHGPPPAERRPIDRTPIPLDFELNKRPPN